MRQEIKKQVYKKRNGVRSYLAGESFDTLNSLMVRLDMSASDLLETGLIALKHRELLLSAANYNVNGTFQTTKDQLKGALALDIETTNDYISKTIDKLEAEGATPDA